MCVHVIVSRQLCPTRTQAGYGVQLSAFLAFGRVGVADVLSTDTCMFTNTCMLSGVH